MLESLVPGVTIKRMDDLRVAYVQHRGPASDIGFAFRRLLHLVREWRVRTDGPMLAIHYDEPEARATPRHWSEAAIPIFGDVRPHSELRVKTLPSCRVASLIHDGPPSKYKESYSTLRKWMKDQGYGRSGPIREIYARDLSELPPGIMYMEIQIPIKKARRK